MQCPVYSLYAQQTVVDLPTALGMYLEGKEIDGHLSNWSVLVIKETDNHLLQPDA